MNCDQIRLELVALLYDELDRVTKQQVLKHLDQCSECQDVWRELKEGRELLGAFEADDPRVSVEVADILAAQTAVSSGRWLRRTTAAALVCGAMLLLSAALGLRLTIEQNSLTLGWGQRADEGSSSDTLSPTVATQQLLDCVARLQELELRFDEAVTHVELNQIRQGTVLASLENELNEVRSRGEVRWRTSNLARRESQAQIDAMQNAVNTVFARLNQTRLRPTSRIQTGG